MRSISAALDASLAGRLHASLRGHFGPAPAPAMPVNSTDRLIAVMFGLVACLVAALAFRALPPGFYDLASGNIWFQADQERVVRALSDRSSVFHSRDSVHPLFSIIAFPPVAVLRFIGMPAVAACETLIVAAAAVCGALLFLILRQMDCDRLVAALGTAAFIVSATFLHWFALAETYALSGASGLIALYLMTLPRVSAASAIAASAITLSMTVTNWMLGLALVGMRFPLARALRRTGAALAICLVLAAIQHEIFPRSGRFYSPKALIHEKDYTQIDMAEHGTAEWTPIDNVRGFFITAAVAPAPYRAKDSESGSPIVDNQRATIADYQPVGIAAAVAWIAALSLSFGSVVRARRVTPTLVALGAFVAGQLALYLVYGEITFLFAANYFAVLIILATVGSAGRRRPVHLAALAAFVVLGAVANTIAFRSAVALTTAIVAAH